MKNEATPESGNELRPVDISSKKDGKLKKMFLLFAHGNRLHRFEAERHGDHCLNSTIPALQRDYGIYFDRESVKVPNNFGEMTWVTKYWLEGKHLNRARKIAGIDKEAA